ncbi:MAG: DUF937 domain-containing protein [Janthinobacterium lividum]
MQLNELLSQFGGVQALAQQLGITEAQAASGAQALAPAILGGMHQQTDPENPSSIGTLLEKFGGPAPLENVLSSEPTDVGIGNTILGTLFGSKTVSKNVAEQAAPTSGLSPELLQKMLPLLAMMLSGYLAHHANQNAANSTNAGTGTGAGGLLGAMLNGVIAARSGNLGSPQSPPQDGLPKTGTGFESILDMARTALR